MHLGGHRTDVPPSVHKKAPSQYRSFRQELLHQVPLRAVTRRVPAGDLRRLRLAYRAGRLLAERDTPAVVQAWFQGLNPVLEDRSHARVLREGDVDEVGPAVSAARLSALPSGEYPRDALTTSG